MFSCLYSQPPSLFLLIFMFSFPCSMALSWMLDLRTQLCIYTSGQQTSKMAQAWSPSTVNVMLRVGVTTFSTKKPTVCFTYQTFWYQYQTASVVSSGSRHCQHIPTAAKKKQIQNIHVNASNHCSNTMYF